MYKILAEDSRTGARVGELQTSHGRIKTPFYMPVATKGSVKCLDSEDLGKIGTEAVISNSLILSWQPGLDLISRAGGIHKLMNWDKVVFTDSGGFQSLDDDMIMKSTHQAAFFRSPFNGITYEITPEKAMDVQHTIGSDIAMCLDDVPHAGDSIREVRSKTLRTHSWARRCKVHHDEIDQKDKQLLFGIAQGGLDYDMRKKSIEFMVRLGFDGIAQGGLAIGEPIESMYDVLQKTSALLPKEKPHYVMGVGNPADMLETVAMGYDCFDSTFPTRNARHGTLFTFKGRLRLGQKRYSEDTGPIEEGCRCFACQNFSRAYIRHLLKNKEGVGKRLATYHNIYFMQRFIERMRQAIEEDSFLRFKKDIQELFRK
ncbi:tRNA guanosine(34) transglycosylase Tgt [Candidatus Woesearchaeota archaeon]|nr:tRNA guanosine(34) transglycosylase Tgt [Candidatus Woesearchaeota archaeon]